MKLTLFAFSFACLFNCAWALDTKCPEILEVKLETGKTVTYCQYEKLMVSRDCYENKQSCDLIRMINEKKSLIKDALVHGEKQNPGSWACEKLNLKVLMGKMWDESDLCTCQNEKNESVICTSLIYL
jgi:hypothetical protein